MRPARYIVFPTTTASLNGAWTVRSGRLMRRRREVCDETFDATTTVRAAIKRSRDARRVMEAPSGERNAGIRRRDRSMTSLRPASRELVTCATTLGHPTTALASTPSHARSSAPRSRIALKTPQAPGNLRDMARAKVTRWPVAATAIALLIPMGRPPSVVAQIDVGGTRGVVTRFESLEAAPVTTRHQIALGNRVL